MRALALACLLALLWLPAAAQDESPVVTPPMATPADMLKHVETVQRMFMLDFANDQMFDGSYYSRLTENLTGNWASVGVFLTAGPERPEQFAELTATSCRQNPTRISVVSPLSLKFTAGREGATFAITYIYRGGTGFSGQVDARDFLDRLGMLERLPQRRQQAIAALANVNSDVAIFRPYAEVLTVVRTEGWPDIYVRCPDAATPVAAPTPEPEPAVFPDGLEAALGRAFDIQIGSADSEVRATFVACAARAFMKLAPDDLRIVIDTDFQPSAEDQQRIKADYPELNAEAGACAEAAQRAMSGQ